MVTLALVEERESEAAFKGTHGRGSYVVIGGGEPTVLGLMLSFAPLYIVSSHHFFPCLTLGALVHPQRWLFHSGLA